MYSNDFRKLAVRLYKKYKNYRKVASLLHISTSTIHRWNTKGIGTKKTTRKSRVFDKVKDFIVDFIEKKPFITQWEISNEIHNHLNLKILKIYFQIPFIKIFSFLFTIVVKS